jgi:hypothetical protein
MAGLSELERAQQQLVERNFEGVLMLAKEALHSLSRLDAATRGRSADESSSWFPADCKIPIEELDAWRESAVWSTLALQSLWELGLVSSSPAYLRAQSLSRAAPRTATLARAATLRRSVRCCTAISSSTLTPHG